MDDSDYLPEEAHDYGPVTFTQDPLYKGNGEEIRVGGRIVGRFRRTSSGSYIGVATISNLSVVGSLSPAGPGSPNMWRKTTRADAVRAILKQAFEDLADERRARPQAGP